MYTLAPCASRSGSMVSATCSATSRSKGPRRPLAPGLIIFPASFLTACPGSTTIILPAKAFDFHADVARSATPANKKRRVLKGLFKEIDVISAPGPAHDFDAHIISRLRLGHGIVLDLH